jgi:SAM-dependent methyltransferase
MATMPPERAPVPESHHYRQVAESFGSDADRYDRARPSYPGALVDRIVAASPGSAVLDVGCGTGIAARQFQAAGCRVLGIDPDARMADLARQSGLEVEVATFEAWDPAGRAFDAVIAAQAWHWIDPVAGAARAAQALRPGGLLAVFWNVAQLPPDLGSPLGPPLQPRRVAGTGAYLRRPQPDPVGQAGRATGGHRRRHRRSGWQFHGAVRHAGGHRGGRLTARYRDG